MTVFLEIFKDFLTIERFYPTHVMKATRDSRLVLLRVPSSRSVFQNVNRDDSLMSYINLELQMYFSIFQPLGQSKLTVLNFSFTDLIT